MKPPPPKLDGDRHVFKALELLQLGVVTPGRVMYCRGRHVLGYDDLVKLGDIFRIPKGADTLCVAPADFADIKAWLD